VGLEATLELALRGLSDAKIRRRSIFTEDRMGAGRPGRGEAFASEEGVSQRAGLCPKRRSDPDSHPTRGGTPNIISERTRWRVDQTLREYCLQYGREQASLLDEIWPFGWVLYKIRGEGLVADPQRSVARPFAVQEGGREAYRISRQNPRNEEGYSKSLK